jgi:hypothetical protein
MPNTQPRAVLWFVLFGNSAAAHLHYLNDLRRIEASKFEPFRPISDLAHFEVAVLNGTVWTTVSPQFESRLDATIHALFLLSRRRPLLDVLVGFQNIRNDGFAGGGSGPPVFSFSRSRGAEYPPLFPDADFWGWAHDWIAPHDLLSAQFSAEQPPWGERAHDVYWSGTLLSANRVSYAKCASEFPATVKLHAESFDETRRPFEAQALKVLKPKSKDLRALLRHKFVAYLTGNGWSTSLKRIAASGGAVVMPKPNPYEDLTSLALERCNCTLAYDPTQICDSLLSVVNNTDDALASAYAEHSQAVAVDELSSDKLLEYIFNMLHGIAKTQARTDS